MTDPPARVWSEVAGDASTSQTVVLVHGSMDRSAGLLRLSRRLDERHRVVRFDRRGYGRSQAVGPPWTVEDNVDDLEAVVLDLRTDDRPVGLFGHSFGGDVALGLAARRPDLVRCVIVYETPLSWLDWWPGDSAGAAAMSAASPGDAAEAFMRRLVGDAVWERLPTSKQEERRAEGAAMVAELADLRVTAPWPAEQITVPVLALRGEHGRPHHRQSTEWLVEHLADCRSFMIPGAGHAGPHTHADAVAPVVEEFLSDGWQPGN